MPKKILLIEDDPLIREILVDFLEDEGYVVDEAENGLKALDHLSHHEQPHLILTDMVMPVMDGWRFAKEYSAQCPSPAPVIVMTAAADAEKRALDIKAANWIAKPFQLDDLLTMIKAHENP